MESYNEKLADLSNVKFVHLSLDRSEDDAEEWAEKESFPWLTVMPEDVEKTEIEVAKGVPEYRMVDANGEVVATGKSAVFAKAAEIGKQAE